jgi:hypothetical protein
MNTRKVTVIGFVILGIVFALQTSYFWWQWKKSIEVVKESSCDYQLKALWLLSRKLCKENHIPFPPHFHVIQDYANRRPSILMTRQISQYLFGTDRLEGAYWQFSLISICAKDPKYLVKVAKASQGLPYNPSYIWHPDARTLAYCPYCGLAVLLDGKLESRGTVKP